jgi:hypothetical protein
VRLAVDRQMAGVVCALYFACLSVLFILLLNQNALAYGVPPLMVAALAVGLLTAVLTPGLAVFTGLAWKERYWSLAGRVHYTLVALAALALVWFLNYWNLLGFRF